MQELNQSKDFIKKPLSKQDLIFENLKLTPPELKKALALYKDLYNKEFKNCDSTYINADKNFSSLKTMLEALAEKIIEYCRTTDIEMNNKLDLISYFLPFGHTLRNLYFETCDSEQIFHKEHLEFFQCLCKNMAQTFIEKADKMEINDTYLRLHWEACYWVEPASHINMEVFNQMYSRLKPVISKLLLSENSSLQDKFFTSVGDFFSDLTQDTPIDQFPAELNFCLKWSIPLKRYNYLLEFLAQEKNKISKLYGSGHALLCAGRTVEAYQCYETGLTHQEELSGYYKLLLETSKLLKLSEDAIESCYAALAAHPSSPVMQKLIAKHLESTTEYSYSPDGSLKTSFSPLVSAVSSTATSISPVSGDAIKTKEVKKADSELLSSQDLLRMETNSLCARVALLVSQPHTQKTNSLIKQAFEEIYFRCPDNKLLIHLLELSLTKGHFSLLNPFLKILLNHPAIKNILETCILPRSAFLRDASSPPLRFFESQAWSCNIFLATLLSPSYNLNQQKEITRFFSQYHLLYKQALLTCRAMYHDQCFSKKNSARTFKDAQGNILPPQQDFFESSYQILLIGSPTNPPLNLDLDDHEIRFIEIFFTHLIDQPSTDLQATKSIVKTFPYLNDRSLFGNNGEQARTRLLEKIDHKIRAHTVTPEEDDSGPTYPGEKQDAKASSSQPSTTELSSSSQEQNSRTDELYLRLFQLLHPEVLIQPTAPPADYEHETSQPLQLAGSLSSQSVLAATPSLALAAETSLATPKDNKGSTSSKLAALSPEEFFKQTLKTIKVLTRTENLDWILKIAIRKSRLNQDETSLLNLFKYTIILGKFADIAHLHTAEMSKLEGKKPSLTAYLEFVKDRKESFGAQLLLSALFSNLPKSEKQRILDFFVSKFPDHYLQATKLLSDDKLKKFYREKTKSQPFLFDDSSELLFSFMQYQSLTGHKISQLDYQADAWEKLETNFRKRLEQIMLRSHSQKPDSKLHRTITHPAVHVQRLQKLQELREEISNHPLWKTGLVKPSLFSDPLKIAREKREILLKLIDEHCCRIAACYPELQRLLSDSQKAFFPKRLESLGETGAVEEWERDEGTSEHDAGNGMTTEMQASLLH